jgi:hypothetical protein
MQHSVDEALGALLAPCLIEGSGAFLFHRPQQRMELPSASDIAIVRCHVGPL